ncbi:hypothetical protein BC826DRAFT_1052125 [Russula brevipes]|nr:hypothetical protein BC826DRAFT_1052125 [Russula brevipes]
MTAPLLENLQIGFVNQLTFSVPCLLQFMRTTEVVGFNHATFLFYDTFVGVKVSSIAQVVNSLSPVFSAVEHLDVLYDRHRQSSDAHNAVDRILWRELLRPLNNVKNLFVENGLIGELSRFLRMSDGESPLELLPELEMIACVTHDDSDVGDAFTPFVDARRNAGRQYTGDRCEPCCAVRLNSMGPRYFAHGPHVRSTVLSIVETVRPPRTPAITPIRIYDPLNCSGDRILSFFLYAWITTGRTTITPCSCYAVDDDSSRCPEIRLHLLRYLSHSTWSYDRKLQLGLMHLIGSTQVDSSLHRNAQIEILRSGGGGGSSL